MSDIASIHSLRIPRSSSLTAPPDPSEAPAVSSSEAIAEEEINLENFPLDEPKSSSNQKFVIYNNQNSKTYTSSEQFALDIQAAEEREFRERYEGLKNATTMRCRLFHDDPLRGKRFAAHYIFQHDKGIVYDKYKILPSYEILRQQVSKAVPLTVEEKPSRLESDQEIETWKSIVCPRALAQLDAINTQLNAAFGNEPIEAVSGDYNNFSGTRDYSAGISLHYGKLARNIVSDLIENVQGASKEHIYEFRVIAAQRKKQWDIRLAHLLAHLPPYLQDLPQMEAIQAAISIVAPPAPPIS